jgi:hypothetical protein
MTTNSATSSSPDKDPKDWVTGDEPATGAQESYLATLAQDAGADIPEQVTKAQASELIDELQHESPRVDDER